jgi:hypothetical protein
MTQSDIIRLAREALKEDDGECYYAYAHQIIHWWGKEDEIVKFANLIAAAERESCADMVLTLTCMGNAKECFEVAATYIRARGQG